MELAESTLLAFVQANLPAKLTELRKRYGAVGPPAVPLPSVKGTSTAAYLPDVVEWLTGDPRMVPVGNYPAVAVSGLDDTIRPLDGDAYRVTYRLRLFVYVREQSYDLTHALRNRLLLGCRELLLGAPGLLALGGRASVVRERLIESYSDVVDDGAGRSLAGAYIEVNLAVSENLDRGPLTGTPLRDVGQMPGTKAGVKAAVKVTVRPSHPALD